MGGSKPFQKSSMTPKIFHTMSNFSRLPEKQNEHNGWEIIELILRGHNNLIWNHCDDEKPSSNTVMGAEQVHAHTRTCPWRTVAVAVAESHSKKIASSIDFSDLARICDMSTDNTKEEIIVTVSHGMSLRINEDDTANNKCITS